MSTRSATHAKFHFVLVLVLLFSALGRIPVHATQIVRYVKWNAIGANTGASWANAFTDLQTALAAASFGDEIWVAAGTYKPTTGTDRTVSFVLKNGVVIYGGFNGTEILASQRNYETNVTILSGDIGVQGNASDNSYHVVVGSNTTPFTVLDGFTVTAGNANGPDGPAAPTSNGGGMYTYQGRPIVTRIIFSNNAAGFSGGGMFNGGDCCAPHGSNPVLFDVVFSSNTAVAGGGMRNENYSSPTLTKVSFLNNTATRSSGGLENFNYSSPTLTNVTFTGNSGGVGPGGMGNFGSSPVVTNATFNNNSALDFGGAIVNDIGAPTYTNITITENTAGSGGGMWNGGSTPTLTNVTFKNNTATTSGGGIYSESSTSLTVWNTILWGNTAPAGSQIYTDASTTTINDSVVQGGFAGGTNIITADPRLGTLGNYGGLTQTIPLQAGSSAINAGNDAHCPATDQREVTRPQGTHCDIGAYEFQKGGDTVGVFRPTNGVIYLKNSNTGGNADLGLNYGMGGDYPITGDWDGDGIDTIGVYRKGVFYLRNSNTVGIADEYFAFGQTGDQPIAGDWDGDGKDTIGVYRSSTFTFYLRNDNSAGNADKVFKLGIPGDIGIAGDWTGKGYDTVGVFRPTNGVIFLKNTNETGYADLAINYGIGGDKPVTGDWNSDGVDTIGVLRGNVFYLRNTNTVGNADVWFALGIKGDMPIAGDWDGKP